MRKVTVVKIRPMYRNIISLLFAAAISVTASAGQTRSVTGAVHDTEGVPIQYATVILQDADGQFADAAVTDSLGRFSFNTALQSFRMVAQHVLYEDNTVDGVDVDDFIIILARRDNEIDEIVVRGERPLVKVSSGVLAYDVEQVTRGKVVTTAYDAILELPGVREEDGSLVLGGGGVSIILNGRPSTLSHQQIIDLLKQMPASSLETAEVMYSAPPQYHVRGAALNLVMRGIASEDGSPVWQGEVNGSYTQQHYANYQAGTSLLYNAGKFSADMLYTYSDNHVRSVYDLYSHHNVNGTIHEIEQHDLGENRLDKHTGRFGLDFRPDDDNQLSLAYNTTITANGRGETYSRGNFSDSYSRKTSNSQLHNLSFDYTSGFGFKGGMNYTYYKHPSVQFYENTDPNGAQTSFVSDARQRIDAVMAYADQAHALRRDWELTYGAKFYYANDHDYQIYRESAGGMQLYDTDNTLKEYIYDLYMGVGKSLTDRLSFNLSLTGEYYKFGRDDDWAVFPQANLSYMHSPQQILQFSFSSDKRYPSYWEKQDHIGYMNGYAEGHGNPNIKAYNYYSAQLTYVLKQKYIFNMFYNYAPDYAVQLAY